MAWLIVGLGVASVAVGAYSAKQAGDAADDSRRSGERQANLDRELAREEMVRVEEDRKRAEATQERALVMNDQQLDLANARYKAWEASYGSIQDNLTNYFSNLTPASLAASGIKDLNKQFEVTQKNIERSFAARGINTAAQDFMTQQAELDLNESRAEIRSDSEMQAANMQSQFLANTPENPYERDASNIIGNKVNTLVGVSNTQLKVANSRLSSAEKTYARADRTQARGDNNALRYDNQAQQGYATIAAGANLAVSNIPKEPRV